MQTALHPSSLIKYPNCIFILQATPSYRLRTYSLLLLFLLTIFSISGFVLVPCDRFSCFLPAFDRTLISHYYYYYYYYYQIGFTIVVLLFWCRLTQVVQEKRPLNECSSISSYYYYQKGETNLDFTEARYSEWQWQQLSHMQMCTLPQTDNHASTPPLTSRIVIKLS